MGEEKISLQFFLPKELCIKLSGDWQITSIVPAVNEVTSKIAATSAVKQVSFDVSKLKKWDSSLVSFIFNLRKECQARGILFNPESLPQGVRKLLSIAATSRENLLPQEKEDDSLLESLGSKAMEIKAGVYAFFDFLGEIAVSFRRLFSGSSYFRWEDFLAIVQSCGANALGLVSLISVLVGIILAFVGVMQLKLFGAQIYIADIVGIAMVRVMGAVMTGIIMSGRTGAAFAAELGLMQTNEEIDSLRTLGISPVEFLVLPRLLAMVIMMPLLTLYADLMGILGGFIISTGMLGINPLEYMQHTQNAVRLNNLWVGLTHACVFGIIIAVAGCLRGMNCQRSASGVGEATTSAVVSAITSIVIATAIITFICQVLGV